VMTMVVVARGVKKGLEKAVRWLMPALFVLLLIMVGYAINSGEFAQGLSFLFTPDFSKLTANGVLIAMGHAFFTLSLGMGAIMIYGSYMPHDASIAKTSIIVALADTAVALLAGMAIFPIVFANGLEPGVGPGLVFSLIEPAVTWLVENKSWSRIKASVVCGVATWLAGLGTVFSFNIWDEATLWGKTVFDLLDYLTSNIMLPLGGLFIAIFAGWVMKSSSILLAGL